MPLQALWIMSYPSVNLNYSYSPERSIWVKIVDLSARLILTFDGWSRGTIEHLFCAPIGSCTWKCHDDTMRGTWWKGYDGQTDRHTGRRAGGRTYQRQWSCANFLIHECVECNPHFCGVQSRCPSVNPSLRDVWVGTWGKQPLVVHLFVRQKCDFVGCDPQLSICLSVQNVALWDATPIYPSTCLFLWGTAQFIVHAKYAFKYSHLMILFRACP